jgi:Holliday junction resolvasome RuvABC DNA-binding subunit
MLEKTFIDFGFTKEQFLKIRNSYAVSTYTDERLLEKFNTITDYFFALGYSKETIMKMIKSAPKVLSLSLDIMKQKEEYLASLGYDRKTILKMLKTAPYLYFQSIEKIEEKINAFIKMGYTKEETIEMFRIYPVLVGLSLENVTQKIEALMACGYTKEEVLKMTKELPTIFGYSMKGLREKIDFYDSVNLHDAPVVYPKNIMQSVALTYARYKFFEDQGIPIDMTNQNRLFFRNKKFKIQFGASKDELLEQYDYKEYLRENKNGRTI